MLDIENARLSAQGRGLQEETQAQEGEYNQMRDEGDGAGHGGAQDRWQRWGAHDDAAQANTWRQWGCPSPGG